MVAAGAKAGRHATSARRRALRQLLVDAVQQRHGRPVPGAGLCSAAEVVAAADRHRVTPAVHLLAKEAGAPAEWSAPLEARYQEQLLRHLSTDADLALVERVLKDLGAPWVAMKGPVLADRLWPRPDMRQYFDLDVLVDRRGFGRAIDALVAHGARLVDRNWPLIRRQMRAELSLQLPYGTHLDLHWDLVNDAVTRRRWPLPVSAMLERAEDVTIGNLRVPTFDAVDTLLSLAQHAALAGATRLVWLKDTERAAAVPGLDWTEVDRRARSTGTNLALTLVLHKAWRALGTRSAHPGWRPALGAWPAVAGVADRVFATPAVADDSHTGQLLYRGVRQSDRASAAAAWAQLTRPPQPVTLPGGAHDDGSNPLHVEVDDVEARAGYFSSLAGAERP